MYNKYDNLELKPHYHIKVDELKADARMWISFLECDEMLCRPFMDFSETLQADKIDFFSDAAKSAKLSFGCYYNGKWAYGLWGRQFIEDEDPSIQYLELYGLTMAIVLWAKNCLTGE